MVLPGNGQRLVAGRWPGARPGSRWISASRSRSPPPNSSFFADDKAFAAPARYRLEAWRDGKWVEVAKAATPLANGVDRTTWTPVTASKLRAVFDLAPGKDMRLVEMKVF